MPVKGKTTKSRTAKSTKKGPKLKWWYILPVIAIVAVAGYAIVRYSQATKEKGVVYADKFYGPGKVEYKSGRNFKNVDTIAGATGILVGENYRNKWVCAEVWVEPGRYYGKKLKGPVYWGLEVDAETYGYKVLGRSVKRYQSNEGFVRECVRIIKNTSFSFTPEYFTGVKPIVRVKMIVRNWYPSTQIVKVSKIWWQDNL